MPSHTGGLSTEPAAPELFALLGDGQPALGRARLEAWLALGFLPDVPSYVRTAYALWRPEVGWTRRPGPLTAELLLGHFRGQWALGGVFAGLVPLWVCDLDNQAGKRARAAGASEVNVDDDLHARAALVRRAWPAAVWMRSSASGGLHAWTFLNEPHPARVLAHLAHARLVDQAAGTPDVAARLAAGGVAGVAGFLELLPQLFEQGGVIRAPLGPGAALLDDDLRPLDLSPGEAMAHLVALATARRVGLLEAFPLARGSRPPAPVPAAVETVASVPPRHARVAPRRLEIEWSDWLHQCDGRLPPAVRPARHVYERVMRRLWQRGLPAESTRHAATFLLALSCRWQGLTCDDAERRLIAWFEGGAGRLSHEWTHTPRAAERKTRQIVRYTYREAPRRRPRRPRYARPGVLHLADQARLEALFPGDPLAVEVGLRVLRWARTNARVLDTGRVICELPMRELGITTRRRRAAWQRLHDSREVFRLYAARVPRRTDDHPRGPCAARPARYTLLWHFAEAGPPIRGRQPLSARRVGYLASLQGVTPVSAITIRRPLCAGVLKTRIDPAARPVGAVRAGAQKTVSERAPACKPLWETRSVFQGRVGGPVGVLYGPSTRPAAAAASTGPQGLLAPRGRGRGGAGERGGSADPRARPPPARA